MTQHHLKVKKKPITGKIKLILFSFFLNSSMHAQYTSIKSELLELNETEFVKSINPLGNILENRSTYYIFEYNESILNLYSVIDEEPVQMIQFDIIINKDQSIYFNRYKEYYDRIGTSNNLNVNLHIKVDDKNKHMNLYYCNEDKKTEILICQFKIKAVEKKRLVR